MDWDSDNGLDLNFEDCTNLLGPGRSSLLEGSRLWYRNVRSEEIFSSSAVTTGFRRGMGLLNGEYFIQKIFISKVFACF